MTYVIAQPCVDVKAPEQWKDFYKANVEFFDDLGSPGGAAKLGKIPKDHPLIAALPPQT